MIKDKDFSKFIKHIFNKYDYKIFNVDALTYAANPKNISDEIAKSERHNLLICDINDTHGLRSLVQNNHINYIVNFAAESHVDNSIKNCMPFIESNIIGTVNLLNEGLQFFFA